MPVALTSLRDALMPGVVIACHANDPIDIGILRWALLKDVVDAGITRQVKDLLNLPKVFVLPDGRKFEEKWVFAGREYPQGWGRGPGGAAAEPPPEPDGKVDTYRTEKNDNRRRLDREIDEFLATLR